MDLPQDQLIRISKIITNKNMLANQHYYEQIYSFSKLLDFCEENTGLDISNNEMHELYLSYIPVF